MNFAGGGEEEAGGGEEEAGGVGEVEEEGAGSLGSRSLSSTEAEEEEEEEETSSQLFLSSLGCPASWLVWTRKTFCRSRDRFRCPRCTHLETWTFYEPLVSGILFGACLTGGAQENYGFLGVHYAELFLRPFVSGSHLCGVFYDPTVSCSEFAIGVQEYGFSGRRILVWFPYSVLLGSTVDTCLASVYEACGLPHCRKRRILRSCSSSKVVDIHFFPQMLFPMVLIVLKTRDSTVARRHDGRCPFRAGCTGSHV